MRLMYGGPPRSGTFRNSQEAIDAIGRKADPEGDSAIIKATREKLVTRKAEIELELGRTDALRRELATIERVLAAYEEEP